MVPCPTLVPVQMVFRCADGSAIGYADPFTALYYSTDGQSFFEVETDNFNGFDREHRLEFRLPNQHGVAQDWCLHRLGDTVTVTDDPSVEDLKLDFVLDPGTTEVWVE